MVAHNTKLHQSLIFNTGAQTQSLRLVGVDLIQDEEGNWHFLEINENPLGLSLADELHSRTQFAPELFKSPFGALSACLAPRGSESVGLLLPYRFRVAGGQASAQLRIVEPVRPDYAVSVHSLVDDFNGLQKELAKRGVKASVSDITGITGGQGKIVTLDGIEFDSALNRLAAGKWFSQTTDTILVNDARARLVCKNKLLARLVLNDALATTHPNSRKIQRDISVSSFDREGVNSLLLESGSNDFIITKPNWGGGGRGVQRFSANDFRDRNCSSEKIASFVGSKDCLTSKFDVVERWVRSRPTRTSSNHDYQFDARVICVDGKATFAHARVAMAPHRFITLSHGSDAAWLTTLGRAKPFSYSAHVDDAYVRVTEDDLQGLISAAEFVVHALDSYCCSMSVDQAHSLLPSQRQLFGPSESIVPLVAVC